MHLTYPAPLVCLAVLLSITCELGGALADDAPVSHASRPKVGAIVPLSGEFARYGDVVRRGIESGTTGDIELLFEDEACLPARTISAYKKLTAVDGVTIFLGPMCGSPQMVLAPLIGAAKHVALLGSAAPEIVHERSGRRMFSVQHSIEQESRYNAEHAYKRGRRKAVIVFAEADYGRAHERAFREAFQGEVIETFAVEEFDSATTRSIALRIRTLAPDLIYIPDASPMLQGFLKGARELGVRDVEILSVYSTQSDDVLNAVGESGEGLLYSYPDIEGDEEALHYFPRRASEILSAIVTKCGANPECVHSQLRTQYPFDENGVLKGGLILKTIRGGKFVRVKS